MEWRLFELYIRTVGVKINEIIQSMLRKNDNVWTNSDNWYLNIAQCSSLTSDGT